MTIRFSAIAFGLIIAFFLRAISKKALVDHDRREGDGAMESGD